LPQVKIKPMKIANKPANQGLFPKQDGIYDYLKKSVKDEKKEIIYNAMA
jgi:hypothetical protein